MSIEVKMIPLELLDAHPDNPRLELRSDIVEGIRAQLRRGPYDEAHAVIVRPLKKRFQILAGHHRVEAAKAEALKTIPAWVREYSDEEAYMQLVLSNVQGALRPIERGKHAKLATTKYGTNGGTSIAKYAEQLGRQETTVKYEIYAWEVYNAQSSHVGRLEEYFRHLVAIHAAPEEHWLDLCQQLVNEKWSVEQTERAVKELRPAKPKAKTKPKIASVTLSQWKEMDAAQQAEVLDWQERDYDYRFNDQKTDNVEWARSSHNPVTGCLHNCPYCYAREIAEHIYPQKFEPALYIERLCAPYKTALPSQAAKDISYKNVFLCSMADLFGRWVPKEWIDVVLATVRDNPQWNFLLLTKFPVRMAEFEYPDNAWLGTTVDLQARVKNAERAMANLRAKVKWLSVEPLLEPLHFEDLSVFQWIVVGGASPVTRVSTGPTPEWRPPWEWVWNLSVEANRAGCLVYHKTNLNHERVKEFPGDPNAKAHPHAAPDVFHYLKVIEP